MTLSSTKETREAKAGAADLCQLLSLRLTCVALAEDSHGLSAHFVHSKGMILWALHRCILLPYSAYGNQILTQTETHLRNTQLNYKSTPYSIKSYMLWGNFIDSVKKLSWCKSEQRRDATKRRATEKSNQELWRTGCEEPDTDSVVGRKKR